MTANTRTTKTPAQLVRAAALLKALKCRYPNAHCALHWSQPHELLIATILSAQSTDVGVNKATPALFAAFRSPAAFAQATPEAIEPFVKSLNFWRNKARAVHESMRKVQQQFAGVVPRTMEQLLTLRGVARKTANVVLGNVFGIHDGVVVDTHVMRLARRMKLTVETKPEKIEMDLMVLFPREEWGLLSHLLISHGRSVCKARGGVCSQDAICKKFCSEVKSKPSTADAKAKSNAKSNAKLKTKLKAKKPSQLLRHR